MAKSVYYTVELIHSENREETVIKRSFENGSIMILRDQAFSYFKELFLVYEDEFILTASLIPIKLTIFSNTVSKERDLDYGQEIIFDRIYTSPMYILTFGKLEERENSSEVEFIKKYSADSRIFNTPDITNNISLSSGESSVISFIRKELSAIDFNMNEVTKSSFQLIECSRCGKKLEVECKVAVLFYNEKNRSYYSSSSREFLMCCNSCIETHYSNPLSHYSYSKIYDKNGKSVYKGDSDLTG